MSNLSPAAKAVLDAAMQTHFAECYSRQIAAAALRAAVDQMVPSILEEEFNDRNQSLLLKKMVEIRQKLNAIADELEAL